MTIISKDIYLSIIKYLRGKKRIITKIFSIFLLLLIHFILYSYFIIVYDMHNGKIINVDKFFNLKDIPSNPNDPLILKEKDSLLNILSINSGHEIKSVNTLFIKAKNRFGNQLIVIGKALFYCGILKCKRIILDKYNWFIQKTIYYEKYNLTISKEKDTLFKRKNIIYDISSNWLFYYSYIKPEIRIDILKTEILKNLPKIETKSNELYIHIRSGDIFHKSNNHNKFYSQPPLCFYEAIIHNFSFNNIFIISENRNNPIVNELQFKFPNITFSQNKIEVDIAYLIYAYNLVGSISTFINMIIRLNDNLKIFFEYDLPTISSKILHCHHSFFKPFKNVQYIKMKPSENYKIIMDVWKNTDLQLKTMINETCLNNFTFYYD